MANIYLVVRYSGEYDNRYHLNLKAFTSMRAAERFADEAEADYQDECQLLDWIREEYKDFLMSYPEPMCQRVNRSSCKNQEEYIDKTTFYEPVYESIHRQEWDEWFESWYGLLTDKLAAMGRVPYAYEDPLCSSHPEIMDLDLRLDPRNFGEYRREHVEFKIDVVELVVRND
jgi:hypothetical protein